MIVRENVLKYVAYIIKVRRLLVRPRHINKIVKLETILTIKN